MKAVIDIVGVDDDGELAAIANDLLEGVVRANCALLRDYPGHFPELYTSGVRFRAEPWAAMPTEAEIAAAPSGYRPMPPIEQFCVYPIILRRGWGDCAQLCAARVGWLRQMENEPDARLRYYVRSDVLLVDGKPQKRRWYHVEVRRGRRGDLAIEDPSRRLDF